MTIGSGPEMYATCMFTMSSNFETTENSQVNRLYFRVALGTVKRKFHEHVNQSSPEPPLRTALLVRHLR